ncbi:GNAT family N-acetyltransferase [Frigidibacter sp. MR17.24]|uniref:GNAT family N-acetyltransferase n=1 Tax=Frigidibacter sp. MR17.24 TaxID=3127345 RepID=UPI003012D8CE
MIDPAIRIRPARLADMAAIGGIVAASWRHTFDGLLPQDFLALITPDSQRSRHERTFARHGLQYLVAAGAKSGEVVGFVSWGPSRDPSFAMPIEIYALYLRPSFERQGIGRLLLESAISAVATSGETALYLTALALNPNRVFYGRLGGIAIDAPPIQLGNASYEQIGFVWHLSP